ncbi:LuxR C-terminal-related transcriptional regulator [Actinoplanes sp. NPDC049316]|uniref:LuxR C-terminal-related transcriptional regulator n=1 Tax=Actinoplanes sp. NPDC049316 TaxID=3154727 RepID=UPI003426AF57
MGEQRVQTKVPGTTVPPRLPRRFLRRERLSAMLDKGVRGPVTLVSAGAGWGKTALVRSWARTYAGPVAWLTLDRRHNALQVFRSDLLTAVHGGAVASPDDDDGSGGFASSVLRQVSGRVVLVLDDVHRVSDPCVLTAIADLLHDVSHRLPMVLVSRTEPTLPLHLVRAAGDLTVIDGSDLAFTAEEAAGLLELNDRRLSEQELREVIEATQGWAVGLRLALDELLRSRTDAVIRDPAGVPESVADYLMREVVVNLPERARQLLIQTSILETVPSELADELTGDGHGREALEMLADADAFVRRSGAEPGVFAYHPQLRTVLRGLLRREEPATAGYLHRRTALWYARRGALRDALRHGIATQDWSFVGRLVVEFAVPLLVSKDRAVLVEALRAIPHDAVTTDAELSLCAAFLLFADGDVEAVAQHVGQVAAMLTERAPAERLTTEVPLHILEAAVIRLRGDMSALVATTTGILRRLASARPGQLPSLPQYRALALNNKGVGLFWTDHLDAADRYLWAGLTASRTSGTEMTEMNALGYLGLLAYLRGSLDEAAAYAEGARELGARLHMEHVAQMAPGNLVAALVEVERLRMVEAEEALRRALHTDLIPPEAALIVLSTVVRARALLAREEPDAARALLREIRHDVPGKAPLLDRWIRLTESEVDLARRNPRPVVARYATAARSLSPAEQVCLGRAYLLLGEHDRAEELLRRAGNAGEAVSAVTAWIGLALLADVQGRANGSVEALARAEALAGRGNVRLPFRTCERPRIAAVIERERWLTSGGATVAAKVLGMEPETGPAAAEGLSLREQDVLSYLPTVLTAGEIAELLGISVNTVKAHMRSINRKLGATRRREAVVRARQLGLL